MRETLNKKALRKSLQTKMSNAFRVGYEKRIRAAERKNYLKTRKIYQSAFQSATEQYLATGLIDRITLLESVQFERLFVDMYSDTGLSFAKWWSKYFKFFSKKLDKPSFDTIWEAYFAQYGRAQAGLKVTSVQDTMRKVFRVRMLRLFQDPEFQALGAEAKARKLRGQRFWAKETRYLSLRVARTESNAAANLGIEQGALSLFNENQLSKRWMTAGDEKVRDTHFQVGKQDAIPFDGYFQVGNVRMKRPGDPEAIGDGKSVAKEVINCRCRLETIPKPENIEDDVFQRIRPNDLRGVDLLVAEYFASIGFDDVAREAEEVF